jgi:hypothetical protein
MQPPNSRHRTCSTNGPNSLAGASIKRTKGGVIMGVTGTRNTVSALHRCRRYAPQFLSARRVAMKRGAASNSEAPLSRKRARIQIPEYHLTPSLRDVSGQIIWPAPQDQITRARLMISEWYVVLYLMGIRHP